jgi:hypothetical protein
VVCGGAGAGAVMLAASCALRVRAYTPSKSMQLDNLSGPYGSHMPVVPSVLCDVISVVTEFMVSLCSTCRSCLPYCDKIYTNN